MKEQGWPMLDVHLYTSKLSLYESDKYMNVLIDWDVGCDIFCTDP